jgi:hypothetical protein
VARGRLVLEFLTDQHFLSALAAAIGPLAFFAAPTEEIEHLLFYDDVEDVLVASPAETGVDEAFGVAKAA